MDLEMPVLDGIEATRAILAEQPAPSVLVLTSFSDRQRITGALEAGAVGYLLKDASADEVVRGIRTAAGGGSPLDPRAARSLRRPERPDPLGDLTASARSRLAARRHAEQAHSTAPRSARRP
jgi:DNA-binding NarL/FixJ family response regulator